MSCAELSELISRLENVTERLESLAVKSSPVGPYFQEDDENPLSVYVTEYESFISEYIDPFVDETKKIESENVQRAGALVKILAEEQKKFLKITSQYSKPSEDVLIELIKPMSAAIDEIALIKDKTYKDQVYGNYVQAINTGVAAFGWITIATPVPYVEECGHGAAFYTNRVIRDRDDRKWTTSWCKVFTPLCIYIKQHHRAGTTWNIKGPVATTNAVPKAVRPVQPTTAPSQDTSALMKDLNKGLAVTAGLKRVTEDMKTHKNPELRSQSPIPAKSQKQASSSSSVSDKKAKTPRTVLVGKKWFVEHHSGKQDLVIENPEMKHTVYVYKCDNCTLQVKGKVNQIILDGCKKTGVVFDTVVSSLEFVNCQSVQGQVLQRLPAATIENTDGCHIYLSKESTDCQIFSSKSSEMNISIPKNDGDYIERPVIEQFKTTWNGEKLLTEPVEIAD